jgi:hypothetical protein
MESSSLQGMSQTPLKRAELREMSLAKRQIIDAKVLGLAGGRPNS